MRVSSCITTTSCIAALSVAIFGVPGGSSQAWAQAGAAPAGAAQAGAIAGSTELHERLERLEKLLRKAEQREMAAPAPAWQGNLYPWQPSYPWQPWYPWFPAPQTYYSGNDYGPSIEHTPRLGLQAIYRNAQHMGIRPPADSDPLFVAPNLGSFEGVVGAAKAQLRAEEKAADARGKAGAAPAFPSADDDEALKLLKAGKYKEAGRIAAARFQESQTVADALLLVEAFFGLGKHSTAQTLLITALEAENAADALPEDISGHFGSADELEKKLQELDSQGGFPLLQAYFKVHSREPEKGLEALQAIPDLPAAKILWKRYLGKAFK